MGRLSDRGGGTEAAGDGHGHLVGGDHGRRVLVYSSTATILNQAAFLLTCAVLFDAFVVRVRRCCWHFQVPTRRPSVPPAGPLAEGLARVDDDAASDDDDGGVDI